MNCTIRLTVLMTLVSLLLNLTASAQKVKGKVEDSIAGEGLSYATITTKNKIAEVLGGTITNENGEFELNITREVEQIEVSHLGYISKVLNRPFAKSMSIFLSVDSELLSEIVVEGEKTSREFLIDRKVINFGGDLQTAGGTVMEAFEQLPEIETDPISQTISLRGNSNVRILVNGKPSPLNNADLLAQINASEVERVEIITSPSARYQADGASGIVNIVLKDKVVKGINGSLNLDARSNPGYGASLNLTSGFEKFNIQGTASYRDNLFLSNNFDKRTILDQDDLQRIAVDREFDGTVKNLSLKADWFINSKNDISMSFSTAHNEHYITPKTTIEIDGVQTFNTLINYHLHETKVYNLNYRKRFNEGDKRYIDFDLDLNNNQNTLPSTAVVNDEVVLDNELFYDNQIVNVAGDLFWTFSNSVVLEAGGLYTLKSIDNQQLSQSNSDVLELNYQYNESTYATYAMIKSNIGLINFQLGLRSEYFLSDGVVNNESEAIDREFWNLFPSIHMSYNKSEKLNYSLGYNRRVSRPSFYALNPLTTINNPLFRREGNPGLTPEFTDNIELGIRLNTKKVTINNSLYYRRTIDLLNNVFKIDDAGITVMHFQNGGKSETLGLESTVSKDFNDKFSSTMTLTGYYQRADPELQDFFYQNQYNYRVRTKLTFKASKKLSADMQWNYFGDGRRLNMTYESMNFVNLAMRYKILKNRGTLNLRFNDIFRGNVYESRRISNQVIEDMRWLGQTRIAVLSFNYRFSQGEIKSRKQKRKNYNESGALE